MYSIHVDYIECFWSHFQGTTSDYPQGSQVLGAFPKAGPAAWQIGVVSVVSSGSYGLSTPPWNQHSARIQQRRPDKAHESLPGQEVRARSSCALQWSHVRVILWLPLLAFTRFYSPLPSFVSHTGIPNRKAGTTSRQSLMHTETILRKKTHVTWRS